MRVLVFVGLLCAVQVQSQMDFWDLSQNFLSKLLRQGKNSVERVPANISITTTLSPSTSKTISPYTTQLFINKNKTTTPLTTTQTESITTSKSTIIQGTTSLSSSTTTDFSTASTVFDTTTPDFVATTGEPRENPNSHEFYLPSTIKREKPQVKISSNISQVCNAVYVRLNWTQPLCACPSRYRDPCSASLNSDDLHTTELSINKKSRKAVTLVKTCEPTSEMRICRAPRDWSLLALQNIRTGKSHYLVICRCPDSSTLEGPMSHDQPTYASVPGIRVYGMMCVDNKRRGRSLRITRSLENPPFPWQKAKELAESALWD
ncbi:hypothetical protein ABEB36_010915 [Hypothenemus hampei]|uniref:Uncharacterized protein n=1 Tax=Hypothenemus hampei TaxID=57062 RepID=A0ABD1EDH0_HYPHA